MDAAKRRLLIVEDDRDLVKLLCELLADAGYEVTCRMTFQDGNQELEEDGYDLLVSDVILPGGSGIELATRAKGKGVPALLLTGHPETIRLCEESGEAYLGKPFQLDELLQSVRRGLRTR